MNKFKTFLEVMAGPGEDVLRLTHSQKRAIRKVMDSGDDPKIAAEQIAQAEDSRNLIAAVKVLGRFGYVTTDPPLPLGPNTEPRTVALTDKGTKAAEEYDIQNDQTLVTPEEQQEGGPEAAEPAAAAPEAGMPGEEGGAEAAAPEAGAEAGGEELEGEGVGLELSSFFHTIHDLAKLKG